MVSVIVPNYNHAKYLRQRIDSILSQTFRDFEIIILDDCSTDESREIIELYRSNKQVTSIIYNEVNSGSTFKQWSKGISFAKGEYVWVAESDDWCEPTFLENIVPYMMKEKDCVLGYCQSYCIIENEIVAQSSYASLASYIPGARFINDYMLSGNAVYNASMAVWKADVYKSISMDFTEFKFCGDWLFWIELSRLGQVFVTGRILNYFRKHDKDVTGKFKSSGLNFVEEVRLLNKIYENQIIGKVDYSLNLNRRYLKFRLQSNLFNPAVRRDIIRCFVKHTSLSTLNMNYVLLIFKYKGYRFLKRFISKNTTL